MSENNTAPSTLSELAGDELDLMTADEVARLFRVPTKWVYAKASAGELPSIKIGVYRRFRRDDLRQYLANPSTSVDTQEIPEAELVRRPRKGTP